MAAISDMHGRSFVCISSLAILSVSVSVTVSVSLPCVKKKPFSPLVYRDDISSSITSWHIAISRSLLHHSSLAVNLDAERCCWCARAVVTRRANKLRILPLIDVHRNVSARSTALKLTPAIIVTEHTLVVGAQTLHYKKITQSDVLHCGPRAERSSSLSDTQSI